MQACLAKSLKNKKHSSCSKWLSNALPLRSFMLFLCSSRASKITESKCALEPMFSQIRKWPTFAFLASLICMHNLSIRLPATPNAAGTHCAQPRQISEIKQVLADGATEGCEVGQNKKDWQPDKVQGSLLEVSIHSVRGRWRQS